LKFFLKIFSHLWVVGSSVQFVYDFICALSPSQLATDDGKRKLRSPSKFIPPPPSVATPTPLPPDGTKLHSKRSLPSVTLSSFSFVPKQFSRSPPASSKGDREKLGASPASSMPVAFHPVNPDHNNEQEPSVSYSILRSSHPTSLQRNRSGSLVLHSPTKKPSFFRNMTTFGGNPPDGDPGSFDSNDDPVSGGIIAPVPDFFKNTTFSNSSVNSPHSSMDGDLSLQSQVKPSVSHVRIQRKRSSSFSHKSVATDKKGQPIFSSKSFRELSDQYLDIPLEGSQASSARNENEDGVEKDETQGRKKERTKTKAAKKEIPNLSFNGLPGTPLRDGSIPKLKRDPPTPPTSSPTPPSSNATPPFSMNPNVVATSFSASPPASANLSAPIIQSTNFPSNESIDLLDSSPKMESLSISSLTTTPPKIPPQSDKSLHVTKTWSLRSVVRNERSLSTNVDDGPSESKSPDSKSELEDKSQKTIRNEGEKIGKEPLRPSLVSRLISFPKILKSSSSMNSPSDSPIFPADGNLSVRHKNSVPQPLGISKKIEINFENTTITKTLAPRGGSGASVFSCEIDGMLCAVKEFCIERNVTRITIARFQNEIELIRRLSHPNIVRYLHHEYRQDVIRLYMTRYESSLRTEILKRGLDVKNDVDDPFSPYDIGRIGYDLACGLQYLHSQKIMHRDLKSDNIFVNFCERGSISRVVIADFDTAKSLLSSEADDNILIGTTNYIAPETLRLLDSPKPQSPFVYTTKVDIWSFAMVIYELLTLQLPYACLCPADALAEIKLGHPPLIPPSADGLPDMEDIKRYEPMIDIFHRCAMASPDSRASAEDVALILKGIIPSLSKY
jgi:hypothetical protein